MRFLLVSVLMLVVSTAGAQARVVGLDELVPLDRQHQIGVHRLSAAEKLELAELIQEVYRLGIAQGRASGAPISATEPTRPVMPSVIESQVDGEFEGWEGETIVKLANGQIWQQSEYYYHYHYAFMPKVLIYRSGSVFKMKVDGVVRSVQVDRLK